MIAADLVRRGYRIAIPYGEDSDFDLIVIRDEKLERVQCKYTRSNGVFVHVQCCSHSLTKGKIKTTKHYTAATIDWLAVYDATTERCYYIPAAELGTGKWDIAPAARAYFEQSAAAHPTCPQLPRDLSGASRIRTGGLGVANAALYQLSYGPVP